MDGRSTWMIVTRLRNEHICVPRRNNKLVTTVVIAKKYLRETRQSCIRVVGMDGCFLKGAAVVVCYR
jgi:hypothetical protein